MRLITPPGRRADSVSGPAYYTALPDRRLQRRFRAALDSASDVVFQSTRSVARLDAQQRSDRETALLAAAVLLVRLSELPRSRYVTRRTYIARHSRIWYVFDTVGERLGHTRLELQRRCHIIRPSAATSSLND